jgi:hypothetical protein
MAIRNFPKSLQSLIERDLVDDYIFEPEHRGGGAAVHWVYLRPGWECDGNHQITGETVAEIRSMIKYIKPCDCKECLNGEPHQL